MPSGDQVFDSLSHIPKLLLSQLSAIEVRETTVSQIESSEAKLVKTGSRLRTSFYTGLSPSLRRLHGTLLFVDISGFTSLSTCLDVDKLKTHINNYFTMILDAIEKYGGDVVKFAGDAVYVVWRTGDECSPHPQEGAARAVQCAIEIIAKCNNYEIRYEDSDADIASQAESASSNGETSMPQLSTYRSTRRASTLLIKDTFNAETKSELTPQSASANDEASSERVQLSARQLSNKNFSQSQRRLIPIMSRRASMTPATKTLYLNVHAGVSSGFMSSVDVGYKNRYEFLILGQPLVDVAAAEGQAKSGELVASETTRKLLLKNSVYGELFVFDELKPGFLRVSTGAYQKELKTADTARKFLEQDNPLEDGDGAASSIPFSSGEKCSSIVHHVTSSSPSQRLVGNGKKETSGTSAAPTLTPIAEGDCEAPAERRKSSSILMPNIPPDAAGAGILGTCPGTSLITLQQHATTLKSLEFMRDDDYSRLMSSQWAQDAVIGHVHESGRVAAGVISRSSGTATPKGPVSQVGGNSEQALSTMLLRQSSSLLNFSGDINEQQLLSMGAATPPGRKGSVTNSGKELKRTTSQTVAMLAEMRKVVCLFIKLTIDFTAYKISCCCTGQDSAGYDDTTNFDDVLDEFNFLKRTKEEIRDDDSVLENLQAILSCIIDILGKHGGQLRQFICDDKGTVCIGTFGLRGSTSADDAVAAIEASKKIISRLQSLGVVATIGVSSGKAYCGLVGSPMRHEYAVMGPSINLSARLMCAADLGTILCDESTRERDNVHEYERLPAMTAKGYDKPVETFRPLTLSAAGSGPAVSSSDGIAMVAGSSGDVKHAVEEGATSVPVSAIAAVAGAAAAHIDTAGKLPLHHPETAAAAVGTSFVGRGDEIAMAVNFFVSRFSAHTKKNDSEPSSDAFIAPTGTVAANDAADCRALEPPPEERQQSQMVIVAGVNGIGKSHCIQEISSSLNKMASEAGLEVLFFKGKSQNFDTTTPFLVWKPIVISMLTALATRNNNNVPGDDFRRNNWKTGLQEALHAVSDLHTVQEASNAVSEILSSTVTAEDADTVMAVTEQQDGLVRLQKIVELICMVMQKAIDALGRGRIVFVIDDINSLDACSWALLRHCWLNLTGAAILSGYGTLTSDEALVDSDGNEIPGIFASAVEFQIISLEPLDKQSIFSILEKELGVDTNISGKGKGVVQDTLDRIYELSGGSPLFAHEISRAAAAALSEQSTQSDEDFWKILSELVEVVRPSRIEELIQHRFDRLDPDCQILLKAASAAGIDGAPFTVNMLSFAYTAFTAGDDDRMETHSEVDEDDGDHHHDGVLRSNSALTAHSMEIMTIVLQKCEFVTAYDSASLITANIDDLAYFHAGAGATTDKPRAASDHTEYVTFNHDTKFHFCSAQIREAIYDLMLNSQKARIHERLAQYFELQSMLMVNDSLLSQSNDDRASSGSRGSESNCLSAAHLFIQGLHWKCASKWSKAMICFFKSAMVLSALGSVVGCQAHLSEAYDMFFALCTSAGHDMSASTLDFFAPVQQQTPPARVQSFLQTQGGTHAPPSDGGSSSGVSASLTFLGRIANLSASDLLTMLPQSRKQSFDSSAIGPLSLSRRGSRRGSFMMNQETSRIRSTRRLKLTSFMAVQSLSIDELKKIFNNDSVAFEVAVLTIIKLAQYSMTLPEFTADDVTHLTNEALQLMLFSLRSLLHHSSPHLRSSSKRRASVKNVFLLSKPAKPDHQTQSPRNRESSSPNGSPYHTTTVSSSAASDWNYDMTTTTTSTTPPAAAVVVIEDHFGYTNCELVFPILYSIGLQYLGGTLPQDDEASSHLGNVCEVFVGAAATYGSAVHIIASLCLKLRRCVATNAFDEIPLLADRIRSTYVHDTHSSLLVEVYNHDCAVCCFPQAAIALLLRGHIKDAQSYIQHTKRLIQYMRHVHTLESTTVSLSVAHAILGQYSDALSGFISLFGVLDSYGGLSSFTRSNQYFHDLYAAMQTVKKRPHLRSSFIASGGGNTEEAMKLLAKKITGGNQLTVLSNNDTLQSFALTPDSSAATDKARTSLVHTDKLLANCGRGLESVVAELCLVRAKSGRGEDPVEAMAHIEAGLRLTQKSLETHPKGNSIFNAVHALIVRAELLVFKAVSSVKTPISSPRPGVTSAPPSARLREALTAGDNLTAASAALDECIALGKLHDLPLVEYLAHRARVKLRLESAASRDRMEQLMKDLTELNCKGSHLDPPEDITTTTGITSTDGNTRSLRFAEGPGQCEDQYQAENKMEKEYSSSSTTMMKTATVEDEPSLFKLESFPLFRDFNPQQ